MPKYIVYFPNGEPIEITEPDYRRFRSRFAGSGEAYMLSDGTLIRNNWNFIKAVPGPSLQPSADIVREEEPDVMLTGSPLTEPEALIDPVGLTGAPTLTSDDLNDIVKQSGLSQADFAVKVGYSAQAVRMALKEGRISAAFSDAVRKAFPTKG